MLMAALRVNIPTVVISGGPMLAGHAGGNRISLSNMFEAVGAVKTGRMTTDDLHEYEENACPLRLLCRNVYRQQYELSYRGTGNGTAG